jgi:hypothetical protein
MKPKTQLQKKPPKNTQPTKTEKKKKKKNPADTVARGPTRAGAEEKPPENPQKSRKAPVKTPEVCVRGEEDPNSADLTPKLQKTPTATHSGSGKLLWDCSILLSIT